MPASPSPIRIDPDRLALDPLGLEPEDFQSPLPKQHYAVIFTDEEVGLAVGIWDTTTMQEAFGPYPGDEYITVLDGGFAMVDAQHAPIATARAGDSVTFRNGAPSSWKQEGYLRKVYLTLHDPSGHIPDIASAKDAFRVVGPAQRPQGTPGPDGVTREVIFRNDAGTMTVTLSAFPDGTQAAAPCPTHRLIRVLAGSLTLTGPDARPEVFSPGTHVFLPKGTDCAWGFLGGTVAVVTDVTA